MGTQEEASARRRIEEVQREYPATHTFDRWLEVYWNTTAVAAR